MPLPAKSLGEPQVRAFVEGLFGSDMHAARIGSLSNAVLGTLNASSLGIHAIGRGLAAARNLVDKHAIKQVDRLLSNRKLRVWELAADWVPFVLAGREEAWVNLDWTDFEDCDHTTLVASLQTHHGRSVPLLWRTIRKSERAGHMADIEDQLVLRLNEVLPAGVQVHLVADRGFCDQEFYMLLRSLGWGFIIRFRGNILVTDAKGETRPASEWVARGGRMRVLKGARVTADQTPVASVVVVKDRAMDDVWCLAVGDPAVSGSMAKRRYGKRFSCEENFRDLKDPRFGMGLRNSKIGIAERRDRMLLIAVLAQMLLTLLGEAGERAGLDRYLKSNTSKKRTMSLLKQGLRWYALIPGMREDRLRLLVMHYEQVLLEHPLAPTVLIRMALGPSDPATVAHT